MLAGGAEAVVLDGNQDPFRTVLRTAAEACERLDKQERNHRRAVHELAGLRDLLSDVHAYLDAQSASATGGDLAAYTLAHRVSRAIARIEAHGADGEALA